MTQNFDSNPGDWVGTGNTTGSNSFGWSNTQYAEGAAQGEAGGFFSRQDNGSYSTDAGSIDLSNTAFSASGRATIHDGVKGSVFLGFWDSNTSQAFSGASSAVNHIGAYLPYQTVVYAEAHAPGYADQQLVADPIGGSRPPYFFATWATSYSFTMNYDPTANGGLGQFVLGIDGGDNGTFEAVINFAAGEKDAFARLDRFGMYSTAVLGTLPNVGEFYFDDLTYTYVAPPAAVTWTGGTSTTWSTGATGNWKLTAGGTPADYGDGADVTFGDSPTRTTANISVADVSPNSVLFNNATTDLTVTGAFGITGATGGVTKQGAAKVTMDSVNSYTGTTTVKAGTLELGMTAQDPVLTGAGGADIQGGKIILDYSATAPDVLTGANGLAASYAAGWATGQIRDTTAGASGLVLGWKDDTTNQQVTVMATLTGDADLNGSVTGADLSLLLSKYNQTGTWSVGDFNYDGSVTGADLSLLLSKYNQSIPASVAGAAVAGVPEPSSLVMLAALAAAMGLGVAGRRRFAARALLRTFRVSILKEVAMKRFLILGVCIVMSSALTARASVMPFGTFTKGGESVAVDYTRTAQSGALAGLDLVILSVDSINGAGSSSINGMVSAGVGNPTFTGLNGSYMYICDPGAVYITNAFPANFTAPGSYVNFDSVSGAFAGTLKSGAPAYAATLGAVHGYSEWSAGVFTTGAGIGVGGTLAGIYVPNNGNFQLVGGLSLQDGNVLTGSGMTTSDIPEPTTLALLATGLLGLLAYAWRKRT